MATRLQVTNTKLESILKTINKFCEAMDNLITQQQDLIIQVETGVNNLMNPIYNFTLEFGFTSSPTVITGQAPKGMSIGSWFFSEYGAVVADAWGGEIYISCDSNAEDSYIQVVSAMAAPDLELNGVTVKPQDEIQNGVVYQALTELDLGEPW